jgi:hypothetical protein
MGNELMRVGVGRNSSRRRARGWRPVEGGTALLAARLRCRWRTGVCSAVRWRFPAVRSSATSLDLTAVSGLTGGPHLPCTPQVKMIATFGKTPGGGYQQMA